MIIFSKFIFILAMLLAGAVSQIGHSEEGSEPKEEAKSEEASEEETAEEEEDGAPAPMSKSAKEYVKKSQTIKTLESQIEMAEKNFAALTKKKANSKTDLETAGILKEMQTEHAVRKRLTLKYNKLRRELMVRFPGEGRKTARKFVPIKEKTIEELEKESSLSKTLTQVKKVIDQKFSRNLPKKESKRLRLSKTLKKIERERREGEKKKKPKKIILER